jgi:hypothetical protein
MASAPSRAVFSAANWTGMKGGADELRGGLVEAGRDAGPASCANFHLQSSTCPSAGPLGAELGLAELAASMRLNLPSPIRPPPRPRPYPAGLAVAMRPSQSGITAIMLRAVTVSRGRWRSPDGYGIPQAG